MQRQVGGEIYSNCINQKELDVQQRMSGDADLRIMIEVRSGHGVLCHGCEANSSSMRGKLL
eukprot:1159489-Pelagomonas_calceolata.AAC.2